MPVKILMVCLGNICRSPLAEGIMQSKLPKDEFIVDSAGTGGWHAGEGPDKRSVTTAKGRGLDISKQKARQFKRTDFEDFDYIYVMDRSNLRDIMRLAPANFKHKVKMIMDELHPDLGVEVPDPYYGGPDGFENVYNMLDEACNIAASKILKNHS